MMEDRRPDLVVTDKQTSRPMKDWKK